MSELTKILAPLIADCLMTSDADEVLGDILDNVEAAIAVCEQPMVDPYKFSVGGAPTGDAGDAAEQPDATTAAGASSPPTDARWTVTTERRLARTGEWWRDEDDPDGVIYGTGRTWREVDVILGGWERQP